MMSNRILSFFTLIFVHFLEFEMYGNLGIFNFSIIFLLLLKGVLLMKINYQLSSVICYLSCPARNRFPWSVFHSTFRHIAENKLIKFKKSDLSMATLDSQPFPVFKFDLFVNKFL